MKKINFYSSVSLLSVLLLNPLSANPQDSDDTETHSVIHRACPTEAIVEKARVGGQTVRVSNHKEIIRWSPSQPNKSGFRPKVFVIDGSFVPDNFEGSLTETHISAAPKKGTPEEIMSRALAQRQNHANHVASIISGIAPHSKLRVYDTKCESENSDDHLVAALYQAIKSKANFVNMSLRLNDGDNDISDEVKKALFAVRDAGIVIYKSIGNNGETIGKTTYTQQLADLGEQMNGKLRFVVNLGYGNNGVEKIDSYSNCAGTAKNYTMSAPGTNILANGVIGPVVKSGSSMAAPMLTGAAARIMTEYPTLSNLQVADILEKSAREKALGCGQFLRPEIYGHGALDLQAALELADQVVHKGVSSSPFPTLSERISDFYEAAKPIVKTGIESAKAIVGGIASAVKSTAVKAVKAAAPMVTSAIKSVSSWFGY